VTIWHILIIAGIIAILAGLLWPDAKREALYLAKRRDDPGEGH